MDVSIFTDFSYSNEDAWNDFLLVNALSHSRYNETIERTGLKINSTNLYDMDDSEEGRSDWLMSHYQEHQRLAVTVGAVALSDLSDVELNNDSQFDDWLKLHAQAHAVLDSVLILS